jgi:hypothetical protein
VGSLYNALNVLVYNHQLPFLNQRSQISIFEIALNFSHFVTCYNPICQKFLTETFFVNAFCQCVTVVLLWKVVQSLNCFFEGEGDGDENILWNMHCPLLENPEF